LSQNQRNYVDFSLYPYWAFSLFIIYNNS